ncbi:hypothetical protein DBV15_12367 [Temnothorax longispinosus]|uniref:Uncharacterized protein n=1 Tax=Temnothorax longispinosus TaxID=300112 RepID=A0A4S2KVA5_9HYME|nr:hypothetical protein DBV15_12367 [Temnothorax longispinosus]
MSRNVVDLADSRSSRVTLRNIFRSLSVDMYIIECRSIYSILFHYSSTGVFGNTEADNCCADGVAGGRDDGRRNASRNCGIQYSGVLFFAFLRVVARAQECAADIQRFAFGGCSLVGDEKEVGGRSDEWIEACGTRSPTRPSGNSTRSSTYHPLSQAGRQADRARARLREKGESCFDSCGGSRLVGVMRRIEFIGSALDQAGLRSSIKKGSECFGIGRTPAGLFAGSERRSIRSRSVLREKPPATIFRLIIGRLSIRERYPLIARRPPRRAAEFIHALSTAFGDLRPLMRLTSA